MPYRKFKETVRKNSLISPGDRILVAFSGGPDSTVLLHFLFLFTEEMDYSLAVAHFNHGLREEADHEEEFCRQRAMEYDLPFFSAKEDVRRFARERGLNLEEAGRILRYEFLDQLARKEGYNKIATGHTLSDQAETLLYRMLRGAGASGLSGIPLLREGKYIRPLLNISRREIMDFIKRVGIPFLEDPSNQDLSFDRNWLRHKLLPILKERFPGIEETLAREADILYHENLWIESLVEGELEKRLRGRRLKVEDWDSLPLGFKRRLLRGFLRKMRGNLRRINFDHIDHLVNLKPGEEYYIPGGERVLRQSRHFFYLGKIPEYREFYFEIPRPGEYEAEGLWRIKLREWEGEGDFSRRAVAYISGVELPIVVRNWRPGDKYTPLGSDSPRKLSNMFNAGGIPGPLRRFIPVFEKDGEIIWVYSLPVAERFKFTGKGFVVKVIPLLPVFQALVD